MLRRYLKICFAQYLLICALLFGAWQCFAQVPTTGIGTAIPPSSSGIGAPNVIAFGANVTSITTTADAPVGSLIVVICGNFNTQDTAISSVGPDSAGNTYTQAVASTVASNYYADAIYYSSNTTHDLPSGGTIPCVNGASNGNGFLAISVSNANTGVDKTNSSNLVATTSPSIATSSLAQANELVVAAANPDSSLTGYSESSGFTTLSVTGTHGTGLAMAYKITNATTAVTWNPSWTTSQVAAAVIATFK